MIAYLSLAMDLFVLIALVGTIYYAMRLSRNLANFKNARNELKSLILDLTQNIDKAQASIDALKQSSASSATDLEDVMHDAKRMTEELKMMNEAGDNLANRLEGLAERNRKIAQGMEPTYEPEDDYLDEEPEFDQRSSSKHDNIETPSFFIQDREFDDEDGAADEFSSQAERELYEALKKNKKQSGGS